MSKGLIGKKIGMTGIFLPNGRHVPVTVLEVGPCVITQIKTEAKDGYNALQLGFGAKKAVNVIKPMAGHLKKSGGTGFAILREFAVDDPSQFEVGQALDAGIFAIGEKVDVIGTIKGRGFGGVVKRHGFHGGGDTHGSMSHRAPGSIGSSAWPSRVLKGKRMAGHYGNSRQTMKNLEIMDVRPEQNLLLVKGAVPGARSGFVAVRKLKF